MQQACSNVAAFRAVVAEAALVRANAEIVTLKAELESARRTVALAKERADLADKIARELANTTFNNS